MRWQYRGLWPKLWGVLIHHQYSAKARIYLSIYAVQKTLWRRAVNSSYSWIWELSKTTFKEKVEICNSWRKIISSESPVASPFYRASDFKLFSTSGRGEMRSSAIWRSSPNNEKNSEVYAKFDYLLLLLSWQQSKFERGISELRATWRDIFMARLT